MNKLATVCTILKYPLWLKRSSLTSIIPRSHHVRPYFNIFQHYSGILFNDYILKGKNERSPLCLFRFLAAKNTVSITVESLSFLIPLYMTKIQYVEFTCHEIIELVRTWEAKYISSFVMRDWHEYNNAPVLGCFPSSLTVAISLFKTPHTFLWFTLICVVEFTGTGGASRF